MHQYSFSDTEKLIHTFIYSRFDYCNALFSVNHNLSECVQIAAARLLTRTKLFHHITPVFSSLLWLPVSFIDM